ncbi:nuclear transport factor 2 family protein [Rhodococcus wratislaviensis]|uniref:nuclear transport factor 2 family protein n=1 Tax=Rhodococcus wratislaviensis TaxID=44752 RepID=UPI0035135801
MNTPTASSPQHITGDPTDFAAQVERITNEGLLEELLALYAPDAVADWIMDGAHDRHEGIAAIRDAATELFTVCTALRLRVRKTVVCAGSDTVVITWTGGFADADRQVGTEIWTYRDGLIVHHQMHSYLDVRASSSPVATLRLLTVAPKVVVTLAKYRLQRTLNTRRQR